MNIKDQNKPEYHYIFGPIPSRRLGISLGVDMIPFKTCPFDCIYCECQKTTHHTLKRAQYAPATSIINEIDNFLTSQSSIDVITFAGSGEPTLNTELEKVIQHVRSHYPRLKMAILTNSSTIDQEEVQNCLLSLDYVLPSLDAILQSTFDKINKPIKGLSLKSITQGLTTFTKKFKGTLWIEIFIVPGINDSENELNLMKQFLMQIKPNRIQLNTLDRPGTLSWIKPVSSNRMKEIASLFLPLPVEIIARKVSFAKHTSDNRMNIENIISTLKRRPLTLEDLAVSFNLSINETSQILNNLLQKDIILQEKLGKDLFYRAL